MLKWENILITRSISKFISVIYFSIKITIKELTAKNGVHNKPGSTVLKSFYNKLAILYPYFVYTNSYSVCICFFTISEMVIVAHFESPFSGMQYLYSIYYNIFLLFSVTIPPINTNIGWTETDGFHFSVFHYHCGLFRTDCLPRF